eukprot:TRINITY_DN12794_c0_g1_i2.p1 TRINITY_DN12794_c0_g1~~TRINITY_DN12794_c0_g1_i2.p1  ORF type:complete len:437 (+),score=53.10 TRINITY_DN12794_c0_g1_i2:2-1312(+)
MRRRAQSSPRHRQLSSSSLLSPSMDGNIPRIASVVSRTRDEIASDFVTCMKRHATNVAWHDPLSHAHMHHLRLEEPSPAHITWSAANHEDIMHITDLEARVRHLQDHLLYSDIGVRRIMRLMLVDMLSLESTLLFDEAINHPKSPMDISEFLSLQNIHIQKIVGDLQAWVTSLAAHIADVFQEGYPALFSGEHSDPTSRGTASVIVRLVRLVRMHVSSLVHTMVINSLRRLASLVETLSTPFFPHADDISLRLYSCLPLLKITLQLPSPSLAPTLEPSVDAIQSALLSVLESIRTLPQKVPSIMNIALPFPEGNDTSPYDDLRQDATVPAKTRKRVLKVVKAMRLGLHDLIESVYLPLVARLRESPSANHDDATALSLQGDLVKWRTLQDDLAAGTTETSRVGLVLLLCSDANSTMGDHARARINDLATHLGQNIR